MLTKAQIANLVATVSGDPAVLRKAQELADGFIRPPRPGENCCAATLSYLLIDVLALPLRPEPTALKLSYVLQHDYDLVEVPVTDPRLPGDIGVVSQPPGPPQPLDAVIGEGDDPRAQVPDGDAVEGPKPDAAVIPVQGAGYVNPDPHGVNVHHIYLVLQSNIDGAVPDAMLVADNQGVAHGRRAGGGNYKGKSASKTNYFLRAVAN